ncbi:MAG: PAS domain-containing protein [Janthinobacterium lividum]
MDLSSMPVDDDDPLFRLSMTGMVIEALGGVAMVWELQDELLFLSGAHAALGLADASLSVEQLRTCLHPDDQSRFDQVIRQCLQGTTGTIDIRLRLLQEDRHWQPVDWRLKAAELDETGRPTRILGVFWPVLAPAPWQIGDTRQ